MRLMAYLFSVVTRAFLEACSTGDLGGLVGLVASDAVAYTDSGGKVPCMPPPSVAEASAFSPQSLQQKEMDLS
jgi:hypothetical protein